jgi:hypothetical protein
MFMALSAKFNLLVAKNVIQAGPKRAQALLTQISPAVYYGSRATRGGSSRHDNRLRTSRLTKARHKRAARG